MQFDLIFEGGGAKGAAFVGALKEFESRGHTARRFVGTSAGAITATLLAAGYGSSKMLEAVNEKLPNGKPRFSTFLDIPKRFEKEDTKNSLTYEIFKKADLSLLPKIVQGKINEKIIDQLMKLDAYRQIFSFVELGGLYAGDNFLAWIREKLDTGGRNLGDVTLADFNKITGSDLSIIASDTIGQEMLVLNHRTSPGCPVAWAVRMSMSIPFIWQEVRWKKDWGLYRGRDISGHTIVDGGALSNFPIHLITSKDKEVREIMGDTDPDEVPNLGFLIDETIEVPGAGKIEEADGIYDLKGEAFDKIRELRTVQRIMRLVDTITKAHDKFSILAHEKEICRLPAKGYGTTEFDMSDARQKALIEAGRKAMEDYFNKIS